MAAQARFSFGKGEPVLRSMAEGRHGPTALEYLGFEKERVGLRLTTGSKQPAHDVKINRQSCTRDRGLTLLFWRKTMVLPNEIKAEQSGAVDTASVLHEPAQSHCKRLGPLCTQL